MNLDQEKQLNEIGEKKEICSLKNKIENIENSIGKANKEINILEDEIVKFQNNYRNKKVHFNLKIENLQKIEADTKNKLKFIYESYESFKQNVINLKLKISENEERNLIPNQRKKNSLKKQKTEILQKIPTKILNSNKKKEKKRKKKY